MTCEFRWQQPVVALKQGNACGAKGHSRKSLRWNAVCGESRMHGVKWGKTTLNRKAEDVRYLSRPKWVSATPES